MWNLQTVTECERVSAWSSVSNPSSPTPLLLTLTLLPFNSPILSTLLPVSAPPTHAHTHIIIAPQSIQTDTHHHFYTSLTPPPQPRLNTHTPPRPLSVRDQDVTQSQTVGEKGKGKMAGKVSISHFITLGCPSRWWHKEWKEKKKKSVRKANEKEIWMKKGRGVDGRGGCRREFKSPIFSLADYKKNQAGLFTGAICFFFFAWASLRSLPPCALGLPSNDPASIVSHCTVNSDCCWLVKWQIQKWRGVGVEKSEKEKGWWRFVKRDNSTVQHPFFSSWDKNTFFFT